MVDPVWQLRRRNRRINWKIPIIITWSQGEVMVREQGHTENVSTSGARILLKGPVPEGKRIRIGKPGAQVARHAQVMWRRAAQASGIFRVGVALDIPNDEFWIELAR